MRLLRWLWPTLFGPEETVTVPEPDRILLPPEPMYRDPTGGGWKPL